MCTKLDTSVAFVVRSLECTPKSKITIAKYLYGDSDDYDISKLQEMIKTKKRFLVCENSHELEAYKSSKRTSYFRHKNHPGSHSKMSDWHSDWQNQFDNVEVLFKKKTDGKNRRHADAVCDDMGLEFQHSNISKKQINDRNHDYMKCHKKELLWIIDCTIGFRVDTCPNGRYILTFEDETWRYEHFMDCEYIYLDHNDEIYRVRPSMVKGHIADVGERKTKRKFIRSLKNNKNNWRPDPKLPCSITYNQRGAGCGKTYESIQLLDKIDIFGYKTTFIYLTLLHSAKEVIYNEFKDQERRGELKVETDDDADDEYGKQYKIKFTCKNNPVSKIFIVGTVDSFTYRIGKLQPSHHDMFLGILHSMINDDMHCKDSDQITYAMEDIRLNRKCLILIDEAQDLREEYLQAMIALMKRTHVDLYIIGDLLQSVFRNESLHKILHETSPNESSDNINIIKTTGKNIVRRFHNKHFVDFTNSIIDYKKYNLPPVESICDGNCRYTHDDKIIPYEIYYTRAIYPGGDREVDNLKLIDNKIKIILGHMDDEIEKYSYVPNNFLFIFPILSGNIYAIQLKKQLQNYWAEKMSNKQYIKKIRETEFYKKYDPNEYTEFVFLHKSEQGQPINLVESENATRISSIHSSKGTGREVVFFLSLSEYALNTLALNNTTLKYESLLHVAVTRQKKSLYIEINNKFDDISKRFEKYGIKSTGDRSRLYISTYISTEQISSHVRETDDSWNPFYELYIKPTAQSPPERNKSDVVIGQEYHIIRYCMMKYSFYRHIINSSDDTKCDRLLALTHELLEMNYEPVNNVEYDKQIKKNAKDRLENIKKNEEDRLKKITGDPTISSPSEQKTFPILNLSYRKDSEYSRYCDILLDIIHKIKEKMKESMETSKFARLCPLEMVIYIFIIETSYMGIYAQINMMDIYSVVYHYDRAYARCDDHSEHYKCLCRKLFSIHTKNTLHTRIQNAIQNHYETIKICDTIFKNLEKKIEGYHSELGSPKISYDISPDVKYHGESGINDEFVIRGDFHMIAYTDTHVFNIVIKPQFGKLNYNDVMTVSILHHKLIKTCYLLYPYDECPTKCGKRYRGKKIITCITSLDSDEPLIFDFNDMPDTAILGAMSKFLICEYSAYHIQLYKEYQYYFKKYNANQEKYPKFKSGTEFFLGKHKLGKHKYSLPKYIKNYFKDIIKKLDKYSAKNETKKMEAELAKLHDRETFLNSIQEYLESSVKAYVRPPYNTQRNVKY